MHNSKWGPFKIGCFGVLTILAMLLIWFGYMLVWAFTAKPGGGNAGALRMDELIAAHQPPGHDGVASFQLIVDAAALYTLEEEAFKRDFPDGSQPADWPSTLYFPYDFDAYSEGGLREDAAANTKALLDRLAKAGMPEALDNIAAQPGFARPIAASFGNESLIGVLLPEMGKIRAFTRYNAARITLGTQTGDDAEVVRGFDTSLAVARSAASDPIIISRLVAIAVAARATGALRTVLNERKFSTETLLALRESLDRQTVWPPFAMYLEGERAFAADMIQRTFSDNGDGDGRMIQTEINKHTGGMPATRGMAALGNSQITNVIGFAYPGKKETLKRANRLYDGMITYARKPAPARRAAPGGMLDFDEAEQRRYPALATIIPALDRAVQADSTLAPLIDGTRLMLVIELYRAKNDGYPASLDALAPEFIPAVPTDAFTGTPFGYIRLATPDEFGRNYILYSYGSNGADDQGAYDRLRNFHTSDATTAVLPLDVVLNPPRHLWKPPE